MTRHPRAQWVLPTVIDPDTSTCYMVPVPDDPFHKAAFLGALATLGSAMSWQNDDAHSAKDVATVWRRIADNLEPCEMVNIRLKPTDFCVIQLSNDGGATWADVADLSQCAHAAAVDEIGQAVDRGDLSGGSQAPGGGPGVPGRCYNYVVTLTGNQRWISPVPVDVGDVITVSSVIGAWTDSAGLVPFWFCGDGNHYSLGQCVGGGGTSGTDPNPALFHMRLVGNIATETTPFFDLYNTSYVVANAGPTDMYIQANDDAIADNQGSLTFHVEICKDCVSPVFYDFSASNGGWTPLPDPPPGNLFATYDTSCCWRSVDNIDGGGTAPNNRLAENRIVIAYTATISKIVIRADVHLDHGYLLVSYDGTGANVGTVVYGDVHDNIANGDDQTFVINVTPFTPTGRVRVDLSSLNDNAGGSTSAIHSILFCA